MTDTTERPSETPTVRTDTAAVIPEHETVEGYLWVEQHAESARMIRLTEEMRDLGEL